MRIFPVFPKYLTGALQAVPTTLTSITTTDSEIIDMEIRNPTAGAITFTLSDGQGSPVYFANAQSISAGGGISISEDQGLRMTGGIKWQAGGSGLTASYRIACRENIV